MSGDQCSRPAVLPAGLVRAGLAHGGVPALPPDASQPAAEHVRSEAFGEQQADERCKAKPAAARMPRCGADRGGGHRAVQAAAPEALHYGTATEKGHTELNTLLIDEPVVATQTSLLARFGSAEGRATAAAAACQTIAPPGSRTFAVPVDDLGRTSAAVPHEACPSSDQVVGGKRGNEPDCHR